MTTTLLPSETTERSLRILPITVNLLPEEIIEARRGRKVRYVVVQSIAGFVLLLLVWFGVANYQTVVARNDVISADAQARQLLNQQRAFGELASIQKERRTIASQLKILMADDLQWSKLYESVQRAAPKSVQVTELTGALTPRLPDGSAPTTPTTPQLPLASGQRSIGTLTVTGSASSKAAVAAYVDELAQLPGVANPLLTGVNQRASSVQFTVRLEITNAALEGRHTSKKSGEN